jgi:hypothetical protein
MTSARRAAIRKAQLASARKRRGKGKKRAAAAGVASLGVVGVTLYAASGYKNRRKARMKGPVNVITSTLPESPSSSSPITTDFQTGVDYGEAGVPVNLSTLAAIKGKPQRIRTKRGKVVSGSGGAKKVLRNRPKFNADRKANYDSDARSAAYQKNLEKNRAKQRQYAANKRNQKRIKKLFSQPVVGNIKLDFSGGASSGWPVFPASSSASRPRLGEFKSR